MAYREWEIQEDKVDYGGYEVQDLSDTYLSRCKFA